MHYLPRCPLTSHLEYTSLVVTSLFDLSDDFDIDTAAELETAGNETAACMPQSVAQPGSSLGPADIKL